MNLGPWALERSDLTQSCGSGWRQPPGGLKNNPKLGGIQVSKKTWCKNKMGPGTSWDVLGTSQGRPGTSWGVLGRPRDILGTYQDVLGRPRIIPSAILLHTYGV